MKHKVQTVRHYVDASGKKRYHGTLALRHTETLSSVEEQVELVIQYDIQYLGLWRYQISTCCSMPLPTKDISHEVC